VKNWDFDKCKGYQFDIELIPFTCMVPKGMLTLILDIAGDLRWYHRRTFQGADAAL